MSGKIKVLVVEPEKPCQVREVEDELKALQAIVGGNIEAVFPFRDSAALICNANGMDLGLLPNRPLVDDSGLPCDIVLGTFFITGVQGENFASLTEEQIGRFKSMYDDMMILTAEPKEKHSEKKKGEKLHER